MAVKEKEIARRRLCKNQEMMRGVYGVAFPLPDAATPTPTVRTHTRVLYNGVMVVGRPIRIGGGVYREDG